MQAPIKNPHPDVAREGIHRFYQIKLSNGKTPRHRGDTATRSARVDLLTPTVVGDRVWGAAKAIGHVVLTSRKTCLRRGSGQTLSLERLSGASPRDARRWPIRSRYTSLERLFGESTIDKEDDYCYNTTSTTPPSLLPRYRHSKLCQEKK